MKLRVMLSVFIFLLACSTCDLCASAGDPGTLSRETAGTGTEAIFEIDATTHIGDVHELAGVNDYGPDVTDVYGDTVAYALFRDLGLQRLRTWCAFGTQLAGDLGFGYRHTIFNGTTLNDARDPAFYNWTYLDILFNVTYSANALPLFTFTGCPISLAREGRPNAPPRNITVYAEVVAHVVKHYMQGWPSGTGHYYDLDYIEIGNEPNLLQFWNGTAAEFLELYGNVSLRLHQLGISSKIGGPGLAGAPPSWASQFLNYVAANSLPLDFFSWHGYSDNLSEVIGTIIGGKRSTSIHGFADVDLVFDEWGRSLGNDTGWDTMATALHGANVLIGASYAGIDIACFAMTKDAPIAYDHPLWGWEANFGLLTRNPTTPKPIYYVLEPFAKMRHIPAILNFTFTSAINTVLDLRFLATRNTNASLSNVLVVNNEDRSISCGISFKNFPGNTAAFTILKLSSESDSNGDGWSIYQFPTDYFPSRDMLVIELAPQSITWILLQNENQETILGVIIVVFVVVMSFVGVVAVILTIHRIREGRLIKRDGKHSD